MLEDLLEGQQGDEAWQSWSLNLTSVLGIASPAAPYGIVGAPAAAFPQNFQTVNYDATKNKVFVASANGYIAAINPVYCFNGGKVSSRRRAAAPAAAAVAAGSSLRGA